SFLPVPASPGSRPSFELLMNNVAGAGPAESPEYPIRRTLTVEMRVGCVDSTVRLSTLPRGSRPARRHRSVSRSGVSGGSIRVLPGDVDRAARSEGRGRDRRGPRSARDGALGRVGDHSRVLRKDASRVPRLLRFPLAETLLDLRCRQLDVE